jgi:soluble lytic murein transglycosylase-like protein
LVVLAGALLAIVAAVVALGWLAAGLAAAGERQRAADLAALAGARALLDAQSLAPRAQGHRGREGALATARREALIAVRIARATAARNGARDVSVSVAPQSAPTRVTVTVTDPIPAPGRAFIRGSARATAETAIGSAPGDGTYSGPLAYRQGKPMRPDVALAFDRLEAAASAAGHRLTVVSGYRSDAEQARLFAAHPDPKWVAPPGRSLHRLGTELDLGPPSAYRWLAANSERFGFKRRYSWESWHFGYVRSPGSASVGFKPARGTRAGSASNGDGATAAGSGALPSWVPATYAGAIRAASIRHGVGAALLAAQLKQESGFNPRAVSRAGARGIAQFIPATARANGLRDPFDPEASIEAQARLMAGLLRRFGSVPLALAAYNAGPGAVGLCWCIPPIAETRAYVAAIVALATGAAAGEELPLVRLVA